MLSSMTTFFMGATAASSTKDIPILAVRKSSLSKTPPNSLGTASPDDADTVIIPSTQKIEETLKLANEKLSTTGSNTTEIFYHQGVKGVLKQSETEQLAAIECFGSFFLKLICGSELIPLAIPVFDDKTHKIHGVFSAFSHNTTPLSDVIDHLIENDETTINAYSLGRLLFGMRAVQNDDAHLQNYLTQQINTIINLVGVDFDLIWVPILKKFQLKTMRSSLESSADVDATFRWTKRDWLNALFHPEKMVKVAHYDIAHPSSALKQNLCAEKAISQDVSKFIQQQCKKDTYFAGMFKSVISFCVMDQIGLGNAMKAFGISSEIQRDVQEEITRQRNSLVMALVDDNADSYLFREHLQDNPLIIESLLKESQECENELSIQDPNFINIQIIQQRYYDFWFLLFNQPVVCLYEELLIDAEWEAIDFDIILEEETLSPTSTSIVHPPQYNNQLQTLLLQLNIETDKLKKIYHELLINSEGSTFTLVEEIMANVITMFNEINKLIAAHPQDFNDETKRSIQELEQAVGRLMPPKEFFLNCRIADVKLQSYNKNRSYLKNGRFTDSLQPSISASYIIVPSVQLHSS